MEQNCYYYVTLGHIVYFCCRCCVLGPVPRAKSDTQKYELGDTSFRAQWYAAYVHLIERVCTNQWFIAMGSTHSDRFKYQQCKKYIN